MAAVQHINTYSRKVCIEIYLEFFFLRLSRRRLLIRSDFTNTGTHI